ncbi:disulfide bond formation protein B [Piscinibacter sp.]|uniref:disulfide bond formation protein B n=1 Tax=Piscinibacter sp. TaxID=1903157 RepID=UPI002B769E82|nr:disulfide bond formation protein B [Albitalea sp.]HUG23893.1 disulfide bond formation protein B [Albitalea sp.]
MPASSSTGRPWLLAMAVLCFAAVGAALASQYVFDMRPCPWCILQRAIFVAIGLLCVLGALFPARAAHHVAAGAALILAAAGATAAIYQHNVAAKSASCALTFADKVINALGLESMAPALFQVTASCADAAVSVIGVPYEFWSLGLFVVLGAASIGVLLKRR